MRGVFGVCTGFVGMNATFITAAAQVHSAHT